MIASFDHPAAPVFAGRLRARLAGAIAALCLTLGLALGVALPSPQARAEGYVSFGFGTSFGHGNRASTGIGWVSPYYGRPYYGRPYYGRPYYGPPYWRRGYYNRGYYHRHYRPGYYRPGYCRPGYCGPYIPRRKYVIRKEIVTTRTVAPAAAAGSKDGCRMTREYQTTITVAGREVEAYGDACLQPDGSWRLGPPRPVPEG